MNPFAVALGQVKPPPKYLERKRKTQPTSVWLTPEQKARFKELGGSRWLQEQIECAKSS